MIDIVARLRRVQGDNEDAREAAAEIERQRNDYSILKRDYDALRAEVERLQAYARHERSLGAEGPMIELTQARQEIERLHKVLAIEGLSCKVIADIRQQAKIEHLRTTLGYLADNIDNPALVAVAEAALKPKP